MQIANGRGFAEVQILKKIYNWSYLKNCLPYFDDILLTHLLTHWYWQDLAQGIAKWHLSSVDAIPSSKFWKSENGPISWTEWSIVMIFFYIDKM